MDLLRQTISMMGILLPYAVRVPRGDAWVQQYTDTGIVGFLFITLFNAIAVGALIGISYMFRRPVPLLIPCILGFGFLGWAHYNLDLASDAQASLALIFIPIYALAPIAVGAAIGYAIDRWLRRHDAA